jgi:hypothetical protein
MVTFTTDPRIAYARARQQAGMKQAMTPYQLPRNPYGGSPVAGNLQRLASALGARWAGGDAVRLQEGQKTARSQILADFLLGETGVPGSEQYARGPMLVPSRDVQATGEYKRTPVGGDWQRLTIDDTGATVIDPTVLKIAGLSPGEYSIAKQKAKLAGAKTSEANRIAFATQKLGEATTQKDRKYWLAQVDALKAAVRVMDLDRTIAKEGRAENRAKRELLPLRIERLMGLRDKLSADGNIEDAASVQGVIDAAEASRAFDPRNPPSSVLTRDYGVVSNTHEDLDLIRSIRKVLAPENQGFVGSLRGAVFGLAQQGNAFAAVLWNTGKSIQDRIEVDGDEISLLAFADRNLSQGEMLKNILSYKLAKALDPGGRLSDVDVKRAQDALGFGRILESVEDIAPRLDIFEDLIIARGNRSAGRIKVDLFPLRIVAGAAVTEGTIARHADGTVIFLKDGKWFNQETGEPFSGTN